MKTELLDRIFHEDGVKGGVVTSFNYNATHSEYLALKDAAEADAAFRATITDLCDRYGMPPGAYPYLYLARRLEERDGTQVSRLADVAANYGIMEGESLADFLLSKCKLVERLEEQLEETQHCLAEAESDVPDEDEVCACALNEKLTLDSVATKDDIESLKKDIGKRLSEIQGDVGDVINELSFLETIDNRTEVTRLRVRDLLKRPRFGALGSYITTLEAIATAAAIYYFIMR